MSTKASRSDETERGDVHDGAGPVEGVVNSEKNTIWKAQQVCMEPKTTSRSPKPNSTHGLIASVLLVDENAGDLETLSVLFEKEGYTVRSCDTHANALDRLESEVFDFIVVSQGGPLFEGRSVLQRANEIDRRLPVLVLARCHDIGCYLEAMQLGALDYFEKPLPPQELLRLVKSHLGSRNSRHLVALRKV